MGIREEAALDAQPALEPVRAIVCRACGAAVTSSRQAIEIDGRHEHTFRNPAGYSFHVLCFREAPGVRAMGAPTTEACWFAGYAWSLALCGECQQHLGWRYSSAEQSPFHGLIATRLVR
ncbi:MAG: cereblon family protein [Vulcanimicrobiota bacterium]